MFHKSLSVHRGGGVVVKGACVARGVYMVRGMHGRGVCGRGHPWQGNMCGGGVHDKGGHGLWGCAWQGECMWQGHAWQDRRPLQQTVRTLLECILVYEHILFRRHKNAILLFVAMNSILQHQSINTAERHSNTVNIVK